MTARDMDRLADQIAEYADLEAIRRERLAKQERDIRRMVRVKLGADIRRGFRP